MTNPIVIVVLGMHRSGTSAITRALVELGVSLGPKLMSGSPDNPKGYWEDMEVFTVNERLLEILGQRWQSIAPIDPSAWERPDITPLRLEAVALVRNRLAAAPMWGFKDPRTARLLPFWKSVLSHAGADIRYLIVCRNPMSVAKSLAKRDCFAIEKSYLLWLQHVIPAMRDTVDAPRVVVDYDNLIALPEKELRRIGSALALHTPSAVELQASEYVKGFVDAELRHAVFMAEDLTLDPSAAGLVQKMNALLQALARDEKCVSDPAIIQGVQQLSDAMDSFSPFAAYLELRERELESMQGQLASALKIVEQLRAQFSADLESKVGIIEAKLLERETQLSELQSQLATVRRSRSWRLTLPLREARRWFVSPKVQSHRYLKAARKPFRRT